MSEDAEDDWFERALSEDDASEDAPAETTDASAENSDDDWFEGDDLQSPDDGSDGTDEFEAEPSETGIEASDAPPGGQSSEADASAENRADTSAAGASDAATADSGGSLFDEDFGSALQSAGEPGGGGDAAVPSEGDFDEEPFESVIPRIDLGIEGLDQMIQGGIPSRHLMVVIGSPGTGKTTFGLQFLHHGLEQGENVVFITLEQSRESILDTADERGWEFDRYEREDRLAIVDLDPVEMANSLENIRGEFPELIREFGADRLVLDSVSLLEMMYDDQARRRTEVFDFTRSLKGAGVTTMFTSEANEDNPYASRHGIIEYLTDAVFVLQYVRGDTQETRLAVEIQKIRNANHSRATKPYAITLDGIDVYQQASIF
ncbi:Circadian regulator protein [Halorhabdus tiamatea SARL4B]|uniref:Circadian clock protein, KaiC n=1 Tax=Halorhabdus tiamatea SARL4B TaxID=1033806 RepID=F7PR42_9EURY|nr:KaiC domain-containing protein [Halorhabdus tiamatea]ERJ07632.1 Circadian regulator protein [Halorhabdus tiamatea SARL4B]CCQ33416.1 circadian clock protein, KaiC [Halorhabdus tiamatea SARL4B]